MQLNRIGPYRLEEQIGAGGMGVVYRAYDERLDRWVAVKFIQPGKHEDEVGRERLRREARASARLSHPAIVRIYDMVQTEEGDGIVMELVEGRPLSQMLRDGPLDLPLALSLGREISAALVEAHSHGIVHRDLKTENVVVTAAGRAKILDFGLAKRLEHGEAEAALTVDGMVLGTCRSMAPEQIEGRAVDPRTDLFSFGTLLYESLTGISPFFDKNVIETLRRVCMHRQPPVRELSPRVPEELSTLIDHLLEKDPAMRPQTAQAVLAALDRIAAGVSDSSSSGSYGGFAGRVPTGSASGSWGAASGTYTSAYTASSDGPPTTVATRRASGERRQVTVLRCSLVDRAGQPLDPEEMLEWSPQVQALVSEVVQRFEGHLEPALGGELHACFGYPVAHEDDARRAVHSALEIAGRAARGLAAGGASPGGAPAVRLGLHTGPIVVARAAGGYRDELSLGDLPHVAGALQSLAVANAVVLSRATHRLVERHFDCEALDPVQPPGATQPIRAFRVLGERDVQSSDEASGAAVIPLVARQQELDLMLERWSLAREGKGQVVLLGGEAGIGKSRLVRELKRRVADDGPIWLAIHGSPYHRNSVLYPVVDLLRRWAGAGGREPLARLEESLARYSQPLSEVVPLFASLLSLPFDERYPPLTLSPEGKRKKTLEAVLALLLEMAEHQPVVLLVEDLQWVDPSTLELLGHLIQEGAASRLFSLMTFRPEMQPPWGQRSYLTQLNLGPLPARQVEQMIERLTEGRKLPPALLAQILQKTDGVPLAVEEMVKMVLEAGLSEDGSSTPRRPLEIPATLRDSLMARLDRLGSAKEVAQLAATLGREFSHDLLSAVSPWEEGWLMRELDRLVEAELLYRRGLPPRARYVFKHGLIQDAAYESLLRSHRQGFHRRIAEVLESGFAEIAAVQPELVAHHATEGGMNAEAVAWWQRAGERALQGSGYAEAAGHLARALEQLATLPESPERDQREIGLQVALGVARGSATSFAEPEARSAFERAWALCSQAGQTPQLFPALRGLYVFHVLSGQPRTARETAQQLLRLAESSADDKSAVLLLSSHQALGFTSMVLGDLPAARAHLERALTFFDPQRARSSAIFAGPQPGVECLGNLSWVLWFLGYPDQALERSHQMLALARDLAQPFSIACALFFAGELRAFRREPAAVREHNEELLALATDQGFPYWLTMGTAQRGWLRTEEGDAEGGTADIHAGCHYGGVKRDPHVFAFLAESYRRQGRIDDALAALDEAADMVDAGQTLFQAELHRLRGELLAEQSKSDAPDAPDTDVQDQLSFALGVARQQGARSLELRAATSLARWWISQGKKEEARELLAPVYGGFTEGLDTPDLREAAGLLGG